MARNSRPRISISKTCSGRSTDLQMLRSLLILLLTIVIASSTRSVSALIDSLVCDDDYGDDDGIVVSPGSAACADNDRQALLMFKASIISDPNNALADWTQLPSGRNCCAWNGVTCDGVSGRVVRLKLPNQQLKGTLSPELGALSELQALILHNNDLSGGIPASLAKLSSLARLCLGGTSLSGSIPEAFGRGLTSLQLLDISDSSLSGSLPASLGGMSRLGRLYLKNNHITGTLPPSFGRLSNLYDATFSNNKLSGRIPEGICSNLTTLISLSLDNNQITGLPTDLHNCVTLQYLSLSGNPLQSADSVAGIVTAPMIMEIDLSNCGLTGNFPSWIEKLPHYEGPRGFDDDLWPSITLSDNKLSGEIPAMAIAALPGYMRTVALDKNRFSGPIPPTFANISSLWGLALQENQFSGVIPSAFEQMTSLTYFNVSYNNLSGSIPQDAPFTNFSISAYQPGNLGLCGLPLAPCNEG
ncbi:hypothetical protein KP509_26G018200 [Ceratopteris richardii]|uniref:Leucine-rich repeat-containing N-terminal plant-type domain-containing protein n=1 Tax=Ceratopteris richardii TaxID=49495 RepID=A0A8T2RLA0_CERRI|nr:hypothetical protein KP509_26G018200 [Ceratopteris richardii]